MRTGNEDSDIQVRPADIRTFLRAYRRAFGNEAAEGRHTYEKLLAGLGNYTTTVAQLERCVRFFFDEAEWRRLGRRSEICLLFDRKADEGMLEPTDAAHALFKQLQIVTDLYQRGRDEVRKVLKDTRRTRVVQLGAVQTLGTYVISAIFSDWKTLWKDWKDPVELQFELNNSNDLIPRLHAGLLNCVMAYGNEEETLIPTGGKQKSSRSVGAIEEKRERGLHVRFHSLEYRTRMGLLCHDDFSLFDKDNNLLEVARIPDKRPETYDELPAIDLQRISFDQSPLIVVPSWDQRPIVDDYASRLKLLGKVREVPRHDEALALVRMNQGMAIVTEVFLLRDRVRAYKFVNEGDFERFIGVYYNTRHGLSAEACRIVEFSKRYLKNFQDELRHGRTPALNHKEPKFHKAFVEFQEGFIRETENEDWAARAEQGFPADRK